MKSTIVVGLQWGDEGKGKIIDALSSHFDYVVRWNGGNNAGHTIVVGGQKFPLSLVPSGVFQEKQLLISQGVVINPKVLLTEISVLAQAGYKVDLTIDPRCHIVMPYHQLLDRANELWKGKAATGSLHLGIGFCYEDRNNRAGIRLEDLVRPRVLKQKLERLVPLKKRVIELAYGLKTNLSAAAIVKEYAGYGRRLKPFVGDVSLLVAQQWDKACFLFEQAHGTMLDPVFGTYPFTVAPPTIASAVFAAVGIPARPLTVLGVVKAYTTRVGNGPLPTEQANQVGQKLQEAGSEIGTVSRRKRRCGWLDLPQLRYSTRLNGCTQLALTKLDVLSGLPKLKVAVGYRLGKKLLKEFPEQINLLSQCRPVYVELPAWRQPLKHIRATRDLPRAAQKYLGFISQELGVPIKYISVGAERKELIQL